MQPVNEDLLHLFRERGALLEGHFLLTSGLHSPRYLQCARVLMDPAVATRLGAELAARVRALLGGVVPRASLLSLEVPTWAAEECPLCTAGSKPEKPGSRPSR